MARTKSSLLGKISGAATAEKYLSPVIQHYKKSLELVYETAHPKVSLWKIIKK